MWSGKKVKLLLKADTHIHTHTQRPIHKSLNRGDILDQLSLIPYESRIHRHRHLHLHTPAHTHSHTTRKCIHTYFHAYTYSHRHTNIHQPSNALIHCRTYLPFQFLLVCVCVCLCVCVCVCGGACEREREIHRMHEV